MFYVNITIINIIILFYSLTVCCLAFLEELKDIKIAFFIFYFLFFYFDMLTSLFKEFINTSNI